MKEKFKEIFKSKLSRAAFALAAIWFALYFALGAAIFDKMWHTSPALPVVGGIVALAPLSAEVVNLFVFKKRRVEIAIISSCPLFCLAHFFFFAFVLSKLTYFLISGTPYFITLGLGALVAFFVFAFPRLGKLWKKITASGLSLVIATICVICLFNAVPFYFDGGATVFAVDDEYQIAFSSSHQSIGSLTVNGKTYHDERNGENNVSKLHKISVPKEELDGAKAYSVRAQSVALNTAYLPSKGVTLTEEYSFRPVDESDGIQIYNLSDTHECISGPSAAAAYFKDKLDLLILNGDIINDVSSEYQISLIYKLAHRVTGGRVPVIYARGNHECNGSLAAELNRYVGCADRGFYYKVKVGTALSLLIIDTGNDMADTNPLISPVANFDEMRKREKEWLATLSGRSGCEYDLLVAHMAYPLSGYQKESCAWSDFARALTKLTRRADLALCGHSHKLDVALPNEGENSTADFPVVRGSLRSNSSFDKEGVSPFAFTGTAIEIKDGKVNIKFTNAKKQVLGEYVYEGKND